jgi:hypothetical protein
MDIQRAVKITPKNMGRIIRGCLAEDAPVEIVHSWSESLASEIEGAWAVGMEAFATGSGLVFAKPGAMEECEVVSA